MSDGMGEDGGPRLVVFDPSRVVEKPRSSGRGRGIRASHNRYTPELGQEIADAMGQSLYSMARLCKEHVNWPDERTITRWQNTHEDFRRMMSIAFENRATLLITMGADILMDRSRDLIQIGENLVPNPVAVARDKLIFEGFIRLAEKLNPKKYGQRLDLNATLGYVSQEDAIRQLK